MRERLNDTGKKRFAPLLATAVILFLFLAVIVLVVAAGLQWFRGQLSIPGLLPGFSGSDGGISENVDYEFGQLLPVWTGNERITVLLMGVDERSQESGPWRTDTLMLLTLDPVSLQAGVLSIPRDLWVPIPGYSDGRINTAHFLGELYGHVDGGPGLARETVEYNLGVQINYYVRVNFAAFVTLVDQIGGVDIYVEETINDPTYPDYNYGYDPLYIQAGWHHFDGELALKYARTRHSSNDFDRARRQQQVMSAILERITSLELIPDLAKNAPEIYRIIGSGVVTDLALDQVLALASLAVKVDRTTIRYGVINEHATQSWVTPEGAQVLIPLREEMRKVRNYVFASEVVDGNSGGSEPDFIPTPTMELATLAVLNGTTRAGLAADTAEFLKTKGFDVITIANADRQDYTRTLVVITRDKPTTLSQVLNYLNLTTTSVIKGNDTTTTQDLTIVLGEDFILPASN